MLRLPRRALLALLLCLSFIAMSAAPASASAQNERNRPAGSQSWIPASVSGWIKYTGTGPGGRNYEVHWDVSWYCDRYNMGDRHKYGLYSPESFRGVEFQVDFPTNTVDAYNGGLYPTTTGFDGDEGFYQDTAFLDGGKKHLGWGMYNSEHIRGCNPDNTTKHYQVVQYVTGPLTPAPAEGLVWRVSAMYEEGAYNACAPGMEFCMFGDYQYTIFKTIWRGTGVDEYGVNYTTPGFRATVAFTTQPNRLELYDATNFRDWGYDIPDHGMNCRATPYKWCYDSGYYTGGDLYYPISGPPGDVTGSGAFEFGDIESNNTVFMKYDVNAPGAEWSTDVNKKASFTAEADVQCIQPPAGMSTCYVLLGAEGVAKTGSPTEQVLVGYDVPADGYWYTCRVDDEHGALPIPGNTSNSFQYSHDKYSLTIGTSARWLGVDNGFIASKVKKATNGFPSSDMYNTPGCQRLAIIG